MDSDPGAPSTGPSGSLVQRVGDYVAAADRLIRQSRQAIGRVRPGIEETDRRVQRTFSRIRDAVGAGQAAGRARTGAEERYLRAKQRELAAHERAIRRHDEAAALQERLGHPDRAARAREHGRQARELHQQALQELHDWAGRMRAVED
ncbi:MAG TPA: hypothetical protein VJ966_08860 [Actinomycetes bacterium]|nr:hypothetical protein [Actinomycetes bacterium]